jgi:hypothetical protein
MMGVSAHRSIIRGKAALGDQHLAFSDQWVPGFPEC